jgi:VWFA-related protein
LNIVLLDLLDTGPLEQAYARERMIRFLRGLPPGRQVALFVLTNQLHMIQDFTADSDTLSRAAQAIDIKQLNRSRDSAQQMRDLDLEAYYDSQATMGGSGKAMERALRAEEPQDLKARLDAVADAFTELSRSVNGYPGRKNLFWLAGNFPSSTSNSLQAISTGQLNSVGGAALGNADPRTGTFTRGDSAETTNSLPSGTGRTPLSERADRAVADSQIAIYPISVTGVETDNVGADQNGLGTGNDRLVDTMAQTFHDRQDSRSVMNTIAEKTGGEAFYGNNDIAGLLQRGFEDSENYYTLAFQPTDRNWNGEYRKLNISLPQRGYSLSYRRGYYAMPEQPAQNAAKQFQAAMSIDSPPSTMLSIRAAPSLAAGPPQETVISATIDLRGIGFATGQEGSRRSRLLVGLMAYPVVSGGGAPMQTSGTLNLNLTPQQYSDLLQTGVFVRQQLPLSAGRYVLRVGVLDTGSGRIGTLTFPVRVP